LLTLLWSADEMVPFMVCMLTGMLILEKSVEFNPAA
jgi:hypothetical protein